MRDVLPFFSFSIFSGLVNVHYFFGRKKNKNFKHTIVARCFQQSLVQVKFNINSALFRAWRPWWRPLLRFFAVFYAGMLRIAFFSLFLESKSCLIFCLFVFFFFVSFVLCTTRSYIFAHNIDCIIKVSKTKTQNQKKN